MFLIFICHHVHCDRAAQQDTWHTLAMDTKMNTRVLEILLASLSTARPYDETKDRVKIPSLSSMKATCALKELLTQDEVADLVEENYSRILACCLVRVGVTCDVQAQEGLFPNDDAVETLRA